MHQRNLNYHLDLLPEDQQLPLMSELVKLLDNVWFKHFVADMLLDRDRSRTAVCSFPLKDVATALTALQTRGEAVAYDVCSNKAYETYNNLTQQIKEQNERRDTGNTNIQRDDLSDAG